MKTNFYILLILLLSFSVANAQENSIGAKVVTVNELNVNKVVLNVNNEVTTSLMIQNNNSNEVIARSSSDIRIYLNRVRKVQNINLLFPKLNKQRVA